ncbi:biotin/lipoyl-binding protein, partial [bacterium]|nr:biotin/lipoyl-binding protein [bacterium]
MRRSLIGIITTSSIIICFLSVSEANTSSQKNEEATLVEVASVEVGNITQELSLVGDIEAQAQVLVFTKIPGKIQELNVEVGSSVRMGDVLAVVEHKELQLGVNQSEAALKAAQAALTQAKALSKIKIMSQVRQAQAGLSAAKAAFDQVKDISFTRTTTQIAQAEAGLEAIKASLKKIKEGAREEERKQVEAVVEQVQAGLDNAQMNYERMKKLFEQGAISKQTFEGIETQYTVA